MDKKPRLIDADALKRAMEELLMSGKDAVESAYINEVVQIVIDEAPHHRSRTRAAWAVGC